MVHFFAEFQWTFHPFIFHSKRFYTVLIWCRVLGFLVVSELSLTELTGLPMPLMRCLVSQASQILRIVTFYSTVLPGPNYHCREVISETILYLCGLIFDTG